VFDAEYATRVASARSQLGEAESHAARVVEAAFVAAWNQRATIATPEQLDGVLDQEVHHGAARALSRRAAAHRFGTHGGRDEAHASAHGGSAEADAQRSWANVAKAIHTEAVTADAHAAVASAGRHDAAAHMKVVAKRRSWAIPVAVGVVALGVSIAGVLYVDRLGEDDAVLAAVSSPGIQPMQSSSGQIGTVTLTDGTKMRIGPETKVWEPDGFPTKLRAVKVEGTAQFEVAPNQKLPFRVVAKRVHVIATGTSFVVSAYPGDSGMMVTVREGSVTVKSGKQSSTVAATQSLLVDRAGMRAPTEEERAQAFNWVDGRVAATNKQLRDVVTQLTRWFNLDIKVPDLKLLDRQATFNVSLDSSRLAIEQVEKSANVQYAYEGESKIFRDAPKAKKK
jgi:ferric-dicitrate binding protein FerR (iron transport regulator)